MGGSGGGQVGVDGLFGVLFAAKGRALAVAAEKGELLLVARALGVTGAQT